MCMPEADILTREVYVSKLELPNHVIDIPTLHRASDHEKLKASIPPGRAKIAILLRALRQYLFQVSNSNLFGPDIYFISGDPDHYTI